MADHFSASTSSFESDVSTSSAPAAKKTRRQVTISTFEKWQKQFDKDHKSLSWLRCKKDPGDRSLVLELFCNVCRQYESKINGMRNYSAAWVNGSSNHKTSNILDHAKSEQHATAMLQERRAIAKASNQPIQTYAPIARSLLVMDAGQLANMKHKFEISYVLAREGIAFLKYPVFHALAERQGVKLGSSYKRNDCAKLFIHFIAEAQRKDFLTMIAKTNFISFMMDGSTDSANKEEELIFLAFCNRNAKTQEVKSQTRFLAIVNPDSSNAEGLVNCLQGAITERLGIDISQKDSVLSSTGKPVIVGGGTDGASVNVGIHNGMKAKMQATLPWLHWVWCFSHRLELACKDAFSSPLFTEINEMLLRLYYLYSKSSKKSKDLGTIVEELKEVFELPKGGDLPVRCHGTRWIHHKRRALQRIVDRYGAYILHINALIEDSRVKADDRSKLQGYVRKWSQGKMLIGCSMYIEVLKAPSILSLTLQDDEVDIVHGLQSIIKAASSLQVLHKEDPQQWSTVKLVLTRVTEEDSKKVYQGSTLSNYTSAMLSSCSNQAKADLQKLNEKMKERLAWSDLKLLRSIIVFLDTRSWSAPGSGSSIDELDVIADDKCHIKESVEYIVTTFREPLEAKGMSVFAIQDELEEIVDFYRQYLDTPENDYKKVWYKLFTAPDATKWPNVLLLSELLFSLPFTNTNVERAFSTMKVIKTDRRSSLNTSTLDDLMEINVEGPPAEDFSADHAVSLWWEDCTRRPNQAPRKEYRKRVSTNDDSTLDEAEPEAIALDAWDNWFMDSDSDSD